MIKQKKKEEENITNKLAVLQQQITTLYEHIHRNNLHIDTLTHQTYATIFDMQQAHAAIHALHEKNATIYNEIETLQEQATMQKQILAQTHAQKKALEKLMEKLHQREQKQKSEMENRLAHESFMHKHLYRK